MTLEELEALVKSLQEQLTSLNNSLSNYATTDNVSAITTNVKTLQNNYDTLKTSVATLDTKVNKINHLETLLDVSLYNLTENDLLQYSNDGKWHNVNPTKLGITTGNSSGSISKLSDMSDVLLGNVENGDVLTYNTSSKKWVNSKVDIETPSVDLSNYLTISSAEQTYFKKTGGVIDGNVTINNTLLVKEMITGEDNVLVHGGVTMYGEE